MFKKADKTKDAPEATPARRAPAPAPAQIASMLSADVVFEGQIRGGDLHIDGVVRGEVFADRVSVGEGGVVEGAIRAETVEIRGRVIGAVEARQVRLLASARVEGDLVHEQLAMEAGAYFQGRSETRTPERSDVVVELLPISA